MLGRKTYLIDRSDEANRATYVAFANSFIGLIAILFGSLGFVVQQLGFQWLIGALVMLSLTGGALSLTLPEALSEGGLSPRQHGMLVSLNGYGGSVVRTV